MLPDDHARVPCLGDADAFGCACRRIRAPDLRTFRADELVRAASVSRTAPPVGHVVRERSMRSVPSAKAVLDGLRDPQRLPHLTVRRRSSGRQIVAMRT